MKLLVVLSALLLQDAAASAQATGAALAWRDRQVEIEEFLKTGPIERIEDVPIGKSQPRRVFFADGGPDWITFTSSSTVTNFVDAVGIDRLRGSSASLASIGPVTSATMRSLDLEPNVQAEAHTIPGLVEAILQAQPPRE